MNIPEAYSIVNITSETVSLFKDCFDRNGGLKQEDKIKWQFLQNPVGKQFVNIAIDRTNKVVAAIYAITPVHFKAGDKYVEGSQSLDTITDVNYRGKGLFVSLARDVYQKAENDGIQLVYGFPNGSSIHGFAKKLAWKVLDPVPYLIRPLNSRYFTQKIGFLKWLPNVNLKWSGYRESKKYIIKSIWDLPQETDMIWKAFAKTFQVGVVRDSSYLNWRYLQKPGEQYKYAACYSQKQECLGFVIYVVKRKHGGKIGYVMELMYFPEYQDVGKQLLNYATHQMNKAGADCILAWCLEHSTNYSAYTTNGYMTLPEKIRPIELHFGCRSFGGDTTLLGDRTNWYLSYSDSDTV